MTICLDCFYVAAGQPSQCDCCDGRRLVCYDKPPREWPAIIPVTADPSWCYPYPSERLWFVHWNGKVFGILARTADDAISDVRHYTRPAAGGTNRLHGFLDDDLPRTHGEWMGLPRR